jgi:hypothetical protein
VRTFSLSDVERDMLYFSPNITEVNDKFEAEYNAVEYEEKIEGLIRTAWALARAENQDEFKGWSDALETLSSEDRYLLLMAGESAPWFSPEIPAPSATKSRGMAALAALVVGTVVFALEMKFVTPASNWFEVGIALLVICPVAAYSLVRILIGDK